MHKINVLRIIFVSTLVIAQHFDEAESIEPITTGLAVGTAMLGSLMISFYPKLKSHFFEVCDDQWINPRMVDLQTNLTARLHGQHLVIAPVVQALRAHIRNPNPSKALVMSFHGWTGNGKNYVSNIIADHLYKEGRNSKFVHTFIATHHFPHNSQIDIYKDQLREWIMTNTSMCERSLFIFDEIDKQPEGLIEAVKPFLDHYNKIGGINYRRNVFIFLSNAGGNEISQHAYEQWQKGGIREDLTLHEMEEIIHNTAFNEEGGLRRSSVLDKNLVSIFIPFLPMERRHIVLCIEDDLHFKNVTVKRHIVEKIADEMRFSPSDTKLYSNTGCKRVSDKVDLVIEELFGDY